MKKVEMFQSIDGSIHKTESEALSRDNIAQVCSTLEHLLGGHITDPGCEFANGDGYYQVSAASIEKFDTAMKLAIRKFEPDIAEVFDSKGKEIILNSYAVGRGLSDRNSPLYGPLHTRLCIDSNNRRWGQMYFALNPTEGKQVELGKVGK